MKRVGKWLLGLVGLAAGAGVETDTAFVPFAAALLTDELAGPEFAHAAAIESAPRTIKIFNFFIVFCQDSILCRTAEILA